MADEKKPEDKKKAPDDSKAITDDVTPRPDPVGERNYALGAPVVRPEGEGTPGAMRHVVPPVPPVKSEEPKPDDVVKTTDATDKIHKTVAPVKPPPPTIKK
jgi:hypothetical protein